jgi:hypothetical protein
MEKSFVAGMKPGHILQDSEKHRVVGWAMKPEEALAFFRSLNKKTITFVGYSSQYEDKDAMLAIVKETLEKYSPKDHVVNIGVTTGGIGAAYPLAKSMGFQTTGIVSYLAIQYADAISGDVDHICFIADPDWGGRNPNTKVLSPTSLAIVHCSDILIGIGGNEISRDEMLAAKELGRPVKFFPAEISHQWAIQRAKKAHQPVPVSFWGAAHAAIMGQASE